MPEKIVYPYSNELLKYEFNKEHPLKPVRLKLTYLLSKSLGLIDKANVIPFKPASRDELELFHTPDFIDAVINAPKTNRINARYGLGIADNPIFPELYEAACWYVGATIEAMKQIIQGKKKAFCISGGLHHAQRSEASGFCIFNDIAIAINYLQKKKSVKVLYFDFDAHHGDGVENAFYRSRDVLTISIHQSGKTLFPGTGYVYELGAGDGVGYSVNIPLLPGSGSKELIKATEEIVIPLFESFQPDLLVTQMGVDAHYLDPLAHLAYTTHGYEHVITRMRKLSEDICSMGWLAVGGGGYHPPNVARLWTLFLALMMNEKIPSELPVEFIEECNSLGYTNIPDGIYDKTEVIQQYLAREVVELDLERVIRRVKELVFPYHGLG